tara:strand:- start:199 stop:609 length:411 start_codon:yes stop_codon:yes gene_type:complete
MEKKIRKNGLVRLNEAGVERAERLVRYGSGDAPAIWGKSRFTEDDNARYRADIQKQIAEAKAAGEDAMHITMRCDGESRLPPTSTNIRIFPNRAYTVLKARTQGYWNYRKHSGQCLILDPVSGREVWVPRSYVEAV